MVEVTKLKRTELEAWKKSQMAEQGFICPFCRGSLRGIPLAKVAADHCHQNGRVRGVLHMSCNRAEGIILKALTTWGGLSTSKGRVQGLIDLAEYWRENYTNPKPLYYPTHKTAEELAAARLRKAKLAAKKRAAVVKSRSK